MIYSELKYINELGGIQAERDDGITVYLDPGSDAHAQAVNGDFGTVAPYDPPFEGIPAQSVKDEAYRRIVAICPEWKQRNLTAQATILAEKGRANWTADELAAWEAGEAIWQSIAAIRAASDEIEAMDPIPQDFAEDSYWR